MAGRVIHHSSISTLYVGLNGLERVATLVDKYDCVHPLQYWSICEFRSLKKETVNDPRRLLWPAYVFNDGPFFHGLSKYLVLHLPLNVYTNDPPFVDLVGHLPEGLVGKNVFREVVESCVGAETYCASRTHRGCCQESQANDAFPNRDSRCSDRGQAYPKRLLARFGRLLLFTLRLHLHQHVPKCAFETKSLASFRCSV